LPRLHNGEKARMVAHQLGVLAVRHLHGRALQTQGWR
jgi:hypothetical protein